MNSSEKKRPRIRLGGVITRQDEILLVQHHRDGNDYYLLPGGGLEWGETCEAGLIRELKEELSLKIEVGPLLFISESIEPLGRRHILNFTFHARIKSGEIKLHPDERLRNFTWVKKSEWLSLPFYPEIRPAILKAWEQSFSGGIPLIPTPWQ